MTLEEVLPGVRVMEAAGVSWGAPVAGLEYDSRRVDPRFLFFAFPGARADGRQFAQDAMAKGAVAVVSESDRPEQFAGGWIRVEHGRRALAVAARNFYRAPDQRLKLTGITGTNGKTTTSFLIDSILRSAGKTTGLTGTIEYHVGAHVLPAANTTPESLDLFRILDQVER
ncbi:MAG: Mur ligase domain-containing protein, partial [Bryobacteraceae bacterium]